VPGPTSSAEAIALVEAARGPDYLFRADAARAYRRLAQLTHPDTCPGDSRAALTHLDAAERHPLRVCRSYRIDGQRLERIIPGPECDLQWQERLTAMLLRARPVYEDPGPDWPGLVEDALGTPVALTSYGPTAADKRAVASALPPRIPGPGSYWRFR
jgi:adenylosuccinate synthase